MAKWCFSSSARPILPSTSILHIPFLPVFSRFPESPRMEGSYPYLGASSSIMTAARSAIRITGILVTKHLTAAYKTGRSDHELDCVVNRHHKTGHAPISQRYRAASGNLFHENRHNRPAGSEHIAEAGAGKNRSLVVSYGIGSSNQFLCHEF